MSRKRAAPEGGNAPDGPETPTATAEQGAGTPSTMASHTSRHMASSSSSSSAKKARTKRDAEPVPLRLCAECGEEKNLARRHCITCTSPACAV